MRFVTERRGRAAWWAGVLSVTLAVAACGGGEEEAGDTAATDTLAAPTNTAGPAALTDAQIVAVLSVADSSEINPSRLAEQQGEAAAVKQYAQMMVRDHGALEDSLLALAQQNGLTPEPNPTSEQMRSEAQATLQSLQGLNGAAFDSAYVQAMITSHQTALTAIDSQLLPAAQNPQLRTALEQKVRPSVVTHLEQAQALQQR